jgi:transcriptional regulator with XRE-family HTH domain
MTPSQFKAWRKSAGLKQKEAAEKLGLKKRMIQYYETGKRDGKHVAIPKAVALACYALSRGVKSFNGSEAVYDDGHAERTDKPDKKRSDGESEPERPARPEVAA